MYVEDYKVKSRQTKKDFKFKKEGEKNGRNHNDKKHRTRISKENY